MQLNKKIQIILCCFALLCFMGCQVPENTTNSQNPRQKETQEETTTLPYDATCFGVVVALDTDRGTISIYNISNRETMNLTYTGATDVRNKYEEIIAMSQVKLGDMVNGGYEKSAMKLKALKQSDEIWEYTKVTGFSMDRTNQVMEIRAGKYKYDSSLVIVSDGELIEPSELSDQDELTIKGYGNTVYSIQITRGHGYVSLKNADYFIGGTVTIGNKIVYAVSDPMLMVVPEGEYTLDIVKNGVGGRKTLMVVKNQETVVDVKSLRGEAQKIGSIQFTVTPAAAKLYINNQEKNHKEVLELSHGTYTVKVEAEGYVTYEADLVIGETFQKRTITLGKDEKETTEKTTTSADETVLVTTAASESTTAPTETTASQETTTAKDSDVNWQGPGSLQSNVSGYKIHITEPSGAEVYFDGEYKGTAPLYFEKVSGEHTIVLKQDGYVTKTYTVDIASDKIDAYFSFAQLAITN